MKWFQANKDKYLLDYKSDNPSHFVIDLSISN
jgi:hypothetical protein